MHNLGHTRSCFKPDHLLQTPDTFIRAPLPGMENATAIVHAGPAIGASFTQYTAEIAVGGKLGVTALQRFIYVLNGSIAIGDGRALAPGGYCYLPPGDTRSITALVPSHVLVIEKEYQPLAGFSQPAFIGGAESDIDPQPLLGDSDVQVRAFLPASQSFDFAVNTLLFQPGATLPMVEIHVMEHGLLMLNGGGIYRLGDCWHPLTAGDFIWMRSYCPQWFGALGKTPAKYILYKDWNRRPQG